MTAKTKIGIMPTDTIYGIVGSALQRGTIDRIYRLRKRSSKKPMIILIGDVRDIARFGVTLDANSKKILQKIWPGAVSIVFPLDLRRKSAVRRFAYLHRGTKTLAFRMPAPAWLRGLLRKTGPLVAPSANLEGRPPARTVREAKRYFGDKVDFYIDVGRLGGAPSTLIKIENGKVVVLRQGAAKIPRALMI